MHSESQSRVDQAYLEYLAQQEGGKQSPGPLFQVGREPELHSPLESLLRDHADVGRVMRLLACRLAPGVRLDDYLLIAELGRGSMGTVWAAVESVAGREVALKVLRGLWEVSPAARRQLAEVARRSARLGHPGLVAIYDLREHDEVLVVAQELVPGGHTLARELSRLREKVRLPQDHDARCAWQLGLVAEALQALHRAGIVHGAVRPSNVLLSSAGVPKLGDIGLSILDEEPRLPGWRSGPEMPYYAAPEQVINGGARQDPRSDVFSLGAVMYEMLTLARPFCGHTPPELARNIVCAAPVPPHRLRSMVAPELSAICLRALAKAPEQRFTDLDEFLAALRPYLPAVGGLARPA